MDPADKGAPLHIPLSSTGISEAFAKTAQMHGFSTLAEILAVPLTEFACMDWFTPEMLEELEKIVRGNP
jgi:hypothetical protein